MIKMPSSDYGHTRSCRVRVIFNVFQIRW